MSKSNLGYTGDRPLKCSDCGTIRYNRCQYTGRSSWPVYIEKNIILG